MMPEKWHLNKLHEEINGTKKYITKSDRENNMAPKNIMRGWVSYFYLLSYLFPYGEE